MVKSISWIYYGQSFVIKNESSFFFLSFFFFLDVDHLKSFC